MTFTYKLARRIARFRAPAVAAIVLALVGCNGTDSLDPDSSAPPSDPGSGSELTPFNQPEMSTAFAGGIPIGTSAQPTSEFGDRYNGALRNIWPQYLLKELADIKARGGKVVLMMAGNQEYYKDASGHFSLIKWKQRIDRFKGVNFSSYVNDGTVIGHFLIDEPNDPNNWNGQQIPATTVEEMAQYSKQIWPGMATIVRAEPSYFNGTYRYLDATWAQYVYRKGDVGDYIRKNVADAQNRGLGLVVGLNLIKGGPNGAKLTATQVESWGSTLLSSSYPCAFISWQYDATYLSNSGIKAAMDVLRSKAESHANKNCGGGSSDPAPEPPPPSPDPAPATGGPALPFGLANTPLAQYSTRWTGATYSATPTELVKQLARADSTHMKIVVTLVPAPQSRNADGTFSLTKWKAVVDRYRDLSLGRFITSGALYLHNLVDQPSCSGCWGGKAIPWETVEEMARYSKSIWSTLPTTVRVPPSRLATASFRWTYLDAGWAEYNSAVGDIQTYLAKQVQQAKLEGLGLVTGLNLLNSSGWNTAPMTASQIKQFGTVLAKESAVCALVGRSYDSGYLSQSGIQSALDSVAKVARSRTSASCVAS